MAQQLRSGRSLAQAVEWAAQAAPPALAPDLHGVVHRARTGAEALPLAPWIAVGAALALTVLPFDRVWAWVA